MKHKRFTRFVSMLLVLATLLGLLSLPAGAATLDNSGTVKIKAEGRHEILKKSSGGTFGSDGWKYTSNDGITGVGYCVNWGLKGVSPSKSLTLEDYNRDPKTMGAFANGYPMRTLAQFKELHSGDVRGIDSLTEGEYQYATQIAVWATCGQLAVPGTSFTAGRASVKVPTSDAKQIRVFDSVKAILAEADTWSKHLYTGMYVRAEENQDVRGVEIINDAGLEGAATDGENGIKKETINGKEYYTRVMYVASATSTWIDDYKTKIYSTNAPEGTIFVAENNSPLETVQENGATCYKVDTSTIRDTNLNANGVECYGAFKVCIPADNVTDTGSFTIKAIGGVAQYKLYLAKNSTHGEQSYIIADPAYTTVDGQADFKWTSSSTPDGPASLQVVKAGAGGAPLEGAKFTLTGSGGTTHEGTTDRNGQIIWKDLPADEEYTLTETEAPEGYQIVAPMSVKVTAGRTEYVTVTDDTEKGFTVKKIDAQNKGSLQGAVFRFEQIDGDYMTTGTTGFDGTISFEGDELPYGSYRVTEETPPDGYQKDTHVETVEWTGEKDVLLTFEDVRDISILLVKQDADTGVSLPNATFDVYADGQKITSVTTNDAGEARITGIKKEAYIEVVETVAPDGYVLDPTPHGIHIDAYNPALQNDPVLTVTNKARPALRILKYDQTTKQPMPDVTFEVYHDGELLGEYTTNANGEILLFDLEPGTYLAKEIATDDNHVVNSTPQQIELKAGQTTTAELVFFNSVKPGIHLIKVDSVTMKSLPNVRFEIKKVGGTFKKEFVTDENGEIDLSKLEPGAYEVRELEAPDGYLIDDAVRVIQLNPDENANFVFTNTPKPSLRLIKTSSDGSRLGGVHFRIAKIEDGSHYLDRITDDQGEINISKLDPGVYSIKETATTADHIIDVREYHVELFPGETSTITIENQKRSTLTIRKTDKDTGEPVPGVTFTLNFSDGHTITTEPTGPDGTVTIEKLLPGVYTITEQNVPEGYILDTTPQQVTLLPNRNASVQFQNFKRPTLKIAKVDINGKHLAGALFEVKTKAGVKIGDFPVGEDGTVTIPNVNLSEGYYIITELQAPKGYILDPTPHEVYLRPGKTTEVSIENEKKPGLTIIKIDSVVGDGVKGAKFELWVSKDKTEDGTYQKLNDTYYFTDENGMIELPELDTGWYKVKEVEPPEGYMLKEPSEQNLYVEHDKGSTITFENIPKSALVIRKIDADTGAPLVNAWFRVRYLGGTSGSGGTIIGEFNTSNNGNIIITGLEAGTYICEEINAPNGYVIDTAPQTAYISGKQQDCITLTFTNSKYGSLLIKKVDSVTGDPLSDVQFFVTTSDGAVVGNSNGYFTTDSAGTILVSDIKPGTTLVVKETRAKDGYALDETPQTVKITSNETMTLEFRNQPLGSLLIRKVCLVNPSVTLKNAEFKVAYADGTLIGDDNGVYRSDENGEVRISGLIPGKSVVVTETRAPAGFIIDTQSQTAQIKEGKTVSLTFKNQPRGAIIIQKRDSQTNQPLAGAQFRATTAAGCEVGLDGVIGTSTLTQNGIFTTNSDGEIKISNLAPGAYVLTEIKAPDGYIMDAPSTNVVVGANGDTQTVVITNTRKGGLIVEKYDSVTKQPLAGGQFKITTASGELVPDNEGLTSSNGLYTTDRSGQIVLSKLLPGTYIVSETKAPDNYQIDPTPQTVEVKAGDTQTVRFYDDPLCTLTILKRDSVTKKPLAKAEFLVKDSEGKAAGPNNGRYVTGTNGTVTVTGLAPNGTYVVSESKAPTGYIKDETPKNIVVRTGVANTLIFDNDPATTLIIHKYIEGTENEPLSGVAFKVVDGSGAAVGPDDGLYYTDKAGEIVLDGLEPGTTVTAREIKTVDGFVLDGTPQDILIKAGEVQNLTFWNKRSGTLLIEKLDSVTKKPLAGAQFKVVYADGRVVDTEGGKLSSNGIYTTDQNGQIKITGLVGTIVVTEEKAPDGYVMDPNGKSQTVVVNPQDTQTLRFYNEPLCSLTLTKLDSVSGKPVPNTEFTVRDGSGTVLGRYTTGKDGTVTVTGLIPGTTVVVTETKVPSGYVLNPTPQTITVTNGTGNSVTSGGVSGSGITTDTIGAGGSNGGNDLTFEDDPKTVLTIQKFVKGTANKPLKGVEFLVTDSSGKVVGSNNGYFYTDANGRITIPGLEPGVTITARETKTLEGYVLDSTPQSIKIKVGETQTMTFWNEAAGTLVIQKKDKISGKPLAGVEFELTYAEGGYVDDANGHLSSKGRYTTDDKGEIRISGIVGTVVVKELKAIDGYIIDPATQTQTVTINPTDTQTLKFYNEPLCSLTLKKVDSVTGKPVPDTEFTVKDGSGSVVGRYTTGKDGTVTVNGLVPGKTYVVTESRVPAGYVLNTQAQTITVKNGTDGTIISGGSSGAGTSTGTASGGSNELVFENAPKSSLEIHKYVDGTDNEPLKGVEFLVTDGSGAPVGPSNGRFYTDKDGRITITDLEPGTTLTVKETKTVDGYALDGEPQTIEIKTGKVQSLTFWNKRTANLTIQKKDSKSGEPLAGAQFLVTDQTGAPVGASDGHFTTGENGMVTVSGLTPGASITVREEKAPAGYVLNQEPQTIVVKSGQDNTLTFVNEAKGSLILLKLDSKTQKPLSGAEFKITTASGELVANLEGAVSSNGMYISDKNGEINLTGLAPDTYVITETKAPDGYLLSTTPTTVEVTTNDTQTIRIYNDPQQTLTIQKFEDGTTNPIQGVTFLITDSSGEVLGPNNGEYVTDKNGRIVLDGLTPGTTITAKETKAANGFVLDSTPQSILIKEGEAQTLTFFNKTEGGLELIKVSEADKSQRIPGVTFEIRREDGALVEKVTTDKQGCARLDLDAGDYYAVEIEAAKGFKLDATPERFTVQDGKKTTLTITNKPFSGIIIHKTDSVTGKGIYGVTFLLYDANNTPIGQFTSDNNGYVYIEGLTTTGRYYLRELENEGYIVDTQMKTVYVTAGATTLVEWKNTPITGQIQIIKKSADYNSTNGLPEGTLLAGAVFEIYDKANNVVDTIKSDNRGLAVSKQLPLGRYTIKEVKAPANYGVNENVLNAYLEHEGQILTFEVTDKSLTTGVSITKTGPKEVMAGQPVRYAFSSIGNNSNVRLDSFYWRDTLPSQVILDQIVTGTYNRPGNYKIVYRVNGGEYQTLADNLSTSKNYTLAASPVALGLTSDERVTEVMFVFGQAPAGFAQVEKPYIHCIARSGLPAGSFVNKADVGGVYNGEWIQAVSRWVTKIYKKSTSLPKTGY